MEQYDTLELQFLIHVLMHVLIKYSKNQVIVTFQKKHGIVSSLYNIFKYTNHLLSVPLDIDSISTSDNFFLGHVLWASRIVVELYFRISHKGIGIKHTWVEKLS